MKNLACSVAILIFFINNISAQNVSFSLTSDSIVFGGQENIIFYSFASIVNNNTDPVDIKAIRVINDMPALPGWQSSMCANVCYGPTTDSIQFTIAPGMSQTFEILFQYAFHNTDTAHVQIFFQSVSPGIIFSQVQNFFGFDSLAVVSVNTITSTKESLNIFPNPAKDILKIECSAFNNTRDIALRIMDAAGKEVLKSKIEKSSSEIYLDVSALKNGIYFINPAPGGAVISSKFVKQ